MYWSVSAHFLVFGKVDVDVRSVVDARHHFAQQFVANATLGNVGDVLGALVESDLHLGVLPVLLALQRRHRFDVFNSNGVSRFRSKKVQIVDSHSRFVFAQRHLSDQVSEKKIKAGCSFENPRIYISGMCLVES